MTKDFIQLKLADWLRRETGISGVRRVADLRGAIASEIGNVRDENQDRAIVFKCQDANGVQCAVAAVADGIGGMKEGAKCASLAIASFASAFCELGFHAGVSSTEHFLKERLQRATMLSNEAVFKEFQGKGGSTFVAVLLVSDKAPLWVSAGDSRIYLQTDREIKCLTVDDTIAGQLNKSGRISPEHSKILQFVGMGEDFEPHVGKVTNASAGRLVLTTDGVHYLEEGSEWFHNVMRNAPDTPAIAQRLISVAKWCGGPDNATLGIVEFPLELSVRETVDHALQVWDAFGELHIQLRLPRPQVQAKDSVPKGSKPAISCDRKKGNQEHQPDDNSEQQSTSKSSKTNRTGKKGAPKKKPNKKKNQTGKDAPQLDIEFPSEKEK